MAAVKTYDIVVVGGGAIGLAAAYECAKAGKSVVVLEKNNFFNQAGSSGDLVRMFRTMYTEDFMANLAFSAMDIWDELEKDAGDTSLRLMSGLLNFGDPKYGAGGPEGTLLGPIPNLKRLDMNYRTLNKGQIEQEYPFKNLPDGWEGLFAPDNGIINVPLMLRTLYRLAQTYGAGLLQNTDVKLINPSSKDKSKPWEVHAITTAGAVANFLCDKIIITSGAYANQVLTPSFDCHLDLSIWEMVASYWSVNPGPRGTIFPSMWFQFADDKGKDSQLFYGFPPTPWGPQNLGRIAVDYATNVIKDPSERKAAVISSADVENVQEFINDRIVGVDASVPAYSLTCLQTNVFDNMFVLDFLPERYLNGGPANSIAIFTAGWAMKFVPLLGRSLMQLVVDGESEYALPQFAIDRVDPATGQPIIQPGGVSLKGNSLAERITKATRSRGSQS